MTETFANLGLAGATLAILFFIVRYFVTAINAKDIVIKDLTAQFLQLAKDDIDSRNQHTKALDINTRSNETIAKVASDSNDKLTVLILKAMKLERSKK